MADDKTGWVTPIVLLAALGIGAYFLIKNGANWFNSLFPSSDDSYNKGYQSGYSDRYQYETDRFVPQQNNTYVRNEYYESNPLGGQKTTSLDDVNMGVTGRTQQNEVIATQNVVNILNKASQPGGKLTKQQETISTVVKGIAFQGATSTNLAARMNPITRYVPIAILKSEITSVKGTINTKAPAKSGIVKRSGR